MWKKPKQHSDWLSHPHWNNAHRNQQRDNKKYLNYSCSSPQYTSWGPQYQSLLLLATRFRAWWDWPHTVISPLPDGITQHPYHQFQTPRWFSDLTLPLIPRLLSYLGCLFPWHRLTLFLKSSFFSSSTHSQKLFGQFFHLKRNCSFNSDYQRDTTSYYIDDTPKRFSNWLGIGLILLLGNSY